MSLATTVSLSRQLYTILEDVEQQTDELTIKGKEAALTYADVYNIAQDLFRVLRRMGLPEDMGEAIAIIQRVITFANALRATLLALELSTPIGWVAGGLSLATMFISMVGSYG